MNLSINNSHISLCFYKEENLNDFIDLFTDEELCKYMAGGAFELEKDAEKLFYYLQNISFLENSKRKAYGIFIEKKLIGHFETVLENNELEIIYLLKKNFWGKGIMFKIISYFNEQNLEYITARVHPNNTNSTKLLEKFTIAKKTLTYFNEQKVLKYKLSKKMANNFEEHWNKAYLNTEQKKLGWYEENAAPTLKLIEKTNLEKHSRILNVGAGTSKLISSLLEKGYNNIIVNDISKIALNKLKEQVGEINIEYIQDDLTKPTILTNINKVDLWNDRAVLHFFKEKEAIETYFNLLKKLVKVNAYVILSEFALDGAAKCCGLDLKRYSLEMFTEQLGENFEIKEHFYYNFRNPNGDLRKYIYALFKRIN
ncbi:MAG: GNAT family N-acetyltransferase [Chitinophagales bacterium]